MKKRTYPYIKQKYDHSCGAACIQMLLAKYGIEVSQDDIWNKISDIDPDRPHIKNCRNSLMIRYFLERGMQACGISAYTHSAVFNICFKKGIDIILNHRIDPKSPAPHYSLLLHKSIAGFHLNDPLNGKPNRTVKHGDFSSMMKKKYPDDGLSANNTMLLVNMRAPLDITVGEMEGDRIEYFSCVKKHIAMLVSEKRSIWVPIKKLQSSNALSSREPNKELSQG